MEDAKFTRKYVTIDNVCILMHTDPVGRIRIFYTDDFEKWLLKQQPKIRMLVTSRLERVSQGHFGDHKRFEGLIELRWKNGIRVYTFQWRDILVVALYGGNKNGQDQDIRKAKKIKDDLSQGIRPLFEP